MLLICSDYKENFIFIKLNEWSNSKPNFAFKMCFESVKLKKKIEKPKGISAKGIYCSYVFLLSLLSQQNYCFMLYLSNLKMCKRNVNARHVSRDLTR